MVTSKAVILNSDGQKINLAGGFLGSKILGISDRTDKDQKETKGHPPYEECPFYSELRIKSQ